MKGIDKKRVFVTGAVQGIGQSVFRCSRDALKLFLEQGAGVLNHSSNHEISPKHEFLEYSVNKGGLGNLTSTPGLEYCDCGIRVNAVAPGATVTPLNASWTENRETQKRLESHIPLCRSASADETTGVFAFFARDDAAYITGQTIYVDGGQTLHIDFMNSWWF